MCLYKTLIKDLDDSDEIQIRLSLMNYLKFWNTSSGSVTQNFNSQTLRGDL